MLKIFITAGISTCVLGFYSERVLGDPALLQGALTLGGGWLICAAFSRYAVWHGIIGGGILALLAAARCAPALLQVAGESMVARFQAVAFAISLVVLVATVRSLMAERLRREKERLEADDQD